MEKRQIWPDVDNIIAPFLMSQLLEIPTKDADSAYLLILAREG